MSKILKFPERPQEQRCIEVDADSIEAEIQPHAMRAGVLAWLFGMVRLVLFLVLYWLRFPVMMVCNLVSVPALLAFLFGLWFSHHAPQYRAMVWGIGGLSFAAFLMRFAYDSLLMWLSPVDTTFTH